MWIYKWLYGARRGELRKRNIKCFYVIIISRPTATTVSTKFHINRLHFCNIFQWQFFSRLSPECIENYSNLYNSVNFKGFSFYFLWLFIIHFYRVPGVEIYQRLIYRRKKNRIWWMKKYYQLTYTPALSKSRE